jgi:hypothetical protein
MRDRGLDAERIRHANTVPKLRVGVQAFAVLTCQSAPVTLQLQVMPLL